MSIHSSAQKRRKQKKLVGFLTVLILILIIAAVAVCVGSMVSAHRAKLAANKDVETPPVSQTEAENAEAPEAGDSEEVTPSPAKWQIGYMAGDSNEVYLTDEDGSPAYAVIRGTQVQYMVCDDGRLLVDVAGTTGYCLASAVKDNLESVVPAQVQYVRTAVNLRTEDNHILDYLTNKGDTVAISGCDYIRDDGSVHMYKVEVDGNEGYIMPWYLAGTYEEAMSNYDQDGNYQIHAGRGDGFGGGSGDNLDYFPREKGDFADQGNVMPDEVRALYLTIDSAEHIDEYLAIAEGTGINTFIFDVQDGGGVAFSAPSVEPYSPSTYRSGYHSAEDYQGYVQKAKDAGYYVVGRITTFTDYNLIYDHPEWSILDETGAAKLINGNYWPSGFNRRVWECKVALAVDAVKLCGFNEIQFDYVRFPDLCAGYEEAGTIDYQSTYGETKAQGIQRFLMYATDVLHEMGVYVGADVFGESAYTYVTAYGQYWPAISNVVDVIGGMPYPDHFGSYGGYRPWEHPYDTVYEWATYAARRQTEIPTPAKVRTWIQCYDAIRSPYNHYGVSEVTAEIKGLRDGGCLDGYMTWNGSSSRNKYTELREAFNY